MATVMPAQLSEPHVPVAKAQTSVLFGIAEVIGIAVPLPPEVVCCAPVLKLALTVTSLYTANCRFDVQPLQGVAVGVGLGVGLGVGVGVTEQATGGNHGSPVPAG